MTPDKIEVGGYYEMERGELFHYTHTGKYGSAQESTVKDGDYIFVKDGTVFPEDFIRPSTREAFNAAVDRVVSKVKGE